VLLIRELPDGRVTHSWQPAESFDFLEYQNQSSGNGIAGRIVPVVARPRDCDQEFNDCYNTCMSRPLPRGYGHITTPDRKKGGKAEYCRKQCWQPYQDCLELQGRRPLEYADENQAVAWLKRNRREILVGTIIVIAGVVFVVVSAGAGAAVLAPLVLVSSSEAPSSSRLAGVSP
jgi:hypothetical protein